MVRIISRRECGLHLHQCLPCIKPYKLGAQPRRRQPCVSRPRRCIHARTPPPGGCGGEGARPAAGPHPDHAEPGGLRASFHFGAIIQITQNLVGHAHLFVLVRSSRSRRTWWVVRICSFQCDRWRGWSCVCGVPAGPHCNLPSLSAGGCGGTARAHAAPPPLFGLL